MSIDLHSLAGPYALDALTDAEQVQFESHLLECSACRAEVAEFRATAARVGAAVSMAPPPDLKARVLAEVSQTRQLPPAPPRIRELGRARPRRRQFLLAAAAAAILGGGGVAAIALQRTSQNRDELIAILGEPDSITRKAPVTGGGEVTVVSSKRRDAAVIILEGVPQAPGDRTHQLWLMGSAIRSAGTVEVTRDPKDVLVRGGVGAATDVGLTIEPTGGSPQPTTTPIVKVPLR